MTKRVECLTPTIILITAAWIALTSAISTFSPKGV